MHKWSSLISNVVSRGQWKCIDLFIFDRYYFYQKLIYIDLSILICYLFVTTCLVSTTTAAVLSYRYQFDDWKYVLKYNLGFTKLSSYSSWDISQISSLKICKVLPFRYHMIPMK